MSEADRRQLTSLFSYEYGLHEEGCRAVPVPATMAEVRECYWLPSTYTLCACSLTRAVHLELLRSLEVAEFLLSLKRLIARRRRSQVLYSENATTFKAAEKSLKEAQKDERFNALLTGKGIQSRFNLRRVP